MKSKAVTKFAFCEKTASSHMELLVSAFDFIYSFSFSLCLPFFTQTRTHTHTHQREREREREREGETNGHSLKGNKIM